MIMLITEAGILNKITNEVSWNLQRSSTGKLLQASSASPLREILREDRQLTTADTEGMFLLMGLGYLIGAIVLVSEIVGGITNKCREIIKRSRVSITTLSSGRNSATISDEEELKAHLARKAQRAKLQAQKTKFSFLREFRLTKATFKEIYGDDEEKGETYQGYESEDSSKHTYIKNAKCIEDSDDSRPSTSDLESTSVNSYLFGSPVKNDKLSTIYENIPTVVLNKSNDL